MYQMLDHEPEEYTDELAEALNRLDNPFAALLDRDVEAMTADKPQRGDIVTLGGKQWRIMRVHRSLPLERGPYRLDLESTTTGNIIRDIASGDVLR